MKGLWRFRLLSLAAMLCLSWPSFAQHSQVRNAGDSNLELTSSNWNASGPYAVAVCGLLDDPGNGGNSEPKDPRRLVAFAGEICAKNSTIFDAPHGTKTTTVAMFPFTGEIPEPLAMVLMGACLTLAGFGLSKKCRLNRRD